MIQQIIILQGDMMGLKSINKDDEFIIETIAYFSYMEQCLDNKIIKKELFDQMYKGLSKTQKEIVGLYRFIYVKAG